MIHMWMIVELWSFFLPMLIAGIVCGIAIAVAFAVVSPGSGRRRWLAFNAVFFLLLFLLGVLSVIVFEPKTSLPALMAGIGPPPELIQWTLPLLLPFTVGSAVVLGASFGSRWWHALALLPASALVMLLLGVNIAAFGLVELSSSALASMARVMVLALVLVFSYAVTTALVMRLPGKASSS